LNGRRREVDLIDRLRQGGIAISLLTVGEIYEGIYSGVNPIEDEAIFRHFLVGVDILNLDFEIMQRVGRIRGSLRSQGLLIPDVDLLIAAIALEYRITLVSRNHRHFDRIPDLLLLESSPL
jgi:predicted nucleic acid-binding protein